MNPLIPMKQIDQHKETAFRLLEGKQTNPGKSDFSAWLKANALDHINAVDRSALIFLASNWDELYPKIPDHLSSPQTIHRWFKDGCPEIIGKPRAKQERRAKRTPKANQKTAFEPAWICGVLEPELPSWMKDFERLLLNKAKLLGVSVDALDVAAEEQRFKRGRVITLVEW